jgi:hypothetical protein
MALNMVCQDVAAVIPSLSRNLVFCAGPEIPRLRSG